MTSPRRLQAFRIAVRKFSPFEAAIGAQWSAFEQVNRTGLRLDLVAMELPELEDALFIRQGMSSGEWDAAFVATDWIPLMHSIGCAVDLQPFLERDPPPDYPAGWSPSLLRLQEVDGNVLGVPYHDGPECLIYRRDLFDDPRRQQDFRNAYGRDLAPPRTWQEFRETARFFNDPSIHMYGTAFAAYPDRHNSIYDFLLQLWTRGGDLHSSSAELRLNTPEAHTALAFYRNIVNDRTTSHPGCRQLDSVRLGAAFAAGDIAMMINWFGFAAYAHTSAESSVRGLVDIDCIPAEDAGKSVSLNVYWILSLAVGSPHRELARRFLFHTQSPAMDKITTDSGAIGCRRSTWNDPQVIARIPFYRRMETLHANAREIPRLKDWPRIASIIDRLITQTIDTDTPIGVLLETADADLAHTT
jgi:multiple sugar transport system substrate-binding protein